MVETGLRVEGCVAQARHWAIAELAKLGSSVDVAKRLSKRCGQGPSFAALIAAMDVAEEARLSSSNRGVKNLRLAFLCST